MRDRIQLRFATAPLGVLGLVCVFATAASGEPIGFVAGVEGTVEIQPAGGSSWAAAAVDNGVNLGDTLRTGRNSAAKVLLVDNTTLAVDEETELFIDKYVVGDLATTQRSILRQLRGQVRAQVGDAFGGSTKLEIHTPTAVAGVKGTDLEVRVRDATLVCNHEGGVFTRSADLNVGGTVDVPPGQCRTVFAGRAPGDAQPPPADFRTVGPGPSGGVPEGTVEAQLSDQLGGQLAGSASPNTAGPGERLSDNVNTEPVFEDRTDVIRATEGGISDGTFGTGDGQAP